MTTIVTGTTTCLDDGWDGPLRNQPRKLTVQVGLPIGQSKVKYAYCTQESVIRSVALPTHSLLAVILAKGRNKNLDDFRAKVARQKQNKEGIVCGLEKQIL